MSRTHTLRAPPSKDDEDWTFVVPANVLSSTAKAKAKPKPTTTLTGKLVRFTADAITLQMSAFPNNRIIRSDDANCFVLVSFDKFRFPDTGPSVARDYIARLMKKGLVVNGIQHRFYHHSNSQLRGRSCFMRRADSDAELDQRIYAMGNFGKIMNVAKRAKRIGLLFSEASIDYQLDPVKVADVPDIKNDDTLFTDGCGLISPALARWLSKAKKIVFRGTRYTPCVYQIRYLGYKGVLMLHPPLNKPDAALAQFRQSMKKFSNVQDYTFSVIESSRPYAFGRLNNDIIVLLSSLGVSNSALLNKQNAYLTWIVNASRNLVDAIDFLSCIGQDPLVERVLLDGLDDPSVQQGIKEVQLREVNSFRKNDKPRVRMMIRESRLIFGVCDPFQVLKEGEVHVKVTVGRKGATALIHGDVLVVRNPCLHPGDCLKLRAVQHPQLAHLVDCIVFATVARPGHQAAPAMSSGGDLDGDKYFVCWDKDIVPSHVFQSYDYPPNKEHVNKTVTRQDLALHFASYNTISLAKVSALHARWVRFSPKGAASPECQELNALHSQSVDGARVKIPDRLLKPPEPTEKFIIDLLTEAASTFADRFIQSHSTAAATLPVVAGNQAAEELLVQLLRGAELNAIGEYELFNMAWRLARKHSLDIRPYLVHLDFGALTFQEKRALTSTIGEALLGSDELALRNSMIRSDLVSVRDLAQRQLNQPFNLQRLYSSKLHGLPVFFTYLQMAMKDFVRKVILLKTDERFTVAIFVRGETHWDDDDHVSDNVVVCSFLPRGSSTFSTFRPCTVDYMLHCSDGNLQLYNKQRADTFIFLNRSARGSEVELVVSIALRKISGDVQRQIGRINRVPIVGIELHVVSNRDRVAHQLFDRWFDHVPTELYTRRFERDATTYTPASLNDIDWSAHPPWLKECFVPKAASSVTIHHQLAGRSFADLETVMQCGFNYNSHEELFWVFDLVILRLPEDSAVALASKWMDQYPPLAFSILKAFPPDESQSLPSIASSLAHGICRNIILSANALGIATLVALEKIATTVAELPLNIYLDILMMAANSIRGRTLVQETLLVLHECRSAAIGDANLLRYVHKHALGVAFERAEEAADECPCGEDGRPGKQRTAPVIVKLFTLPDKPGQVKAHVRIDSRTAVRLHSNVRLQSASQLEPGSAWREAFIVDGIVVQAARGEMIIELYFPVPPEVSKMDWKMYDTGSVATSNAMMDALLRLQEREDACQFYNTIIAPAQEESGINVVSQEQEEHDNVIDPDLNRSQNNAVHASSTSNLSLIWGPPGTGKTTVVVKILRKMLKESPSDLQILMTASTHNAVDNVLDRFIKLNREESLISDDSILRVATNQAKVNSALQSYTIDARVGGDLNENNKLVKQAQQRVKAARIIFTTCAGAGLGILRKFDFDIAIIDEASQITEPVALIPLVKGIRRAILVGDHVQLRPTVRPMAKALLFDVSLLERLYTTGDPGEMSRVMLDVQYRFPESLARFPSTEFYEGRLKTGTEFPPTHITNYFSTHSQFPWPRSASAGTPSLAVFIQCSEEEDMGGRSKSNEGQAELAAHVIPLLKQARPSTAGETADATDEDIAHQLGELEVTVLTPYTKQVAAIKSALNKRNCAGVSCSTIDSFQGRETDIVVFSSVRCNVDADVGFVEDARRLNVMWTRARFGLVLVGDRRTLTEKSELWKRAIDSCVEVKVDFVSTTLL